MLPGWSPTGDEDIIRRTVREFMEKTVSPIAARIDRENIVPEQILREAAEMGLFSLRVPERYGGPGLSMRETVVAVEEVSRVSSALGVMSAVSGSIAVFPLLAYASEDLGRHYLERLASGEIAAFALTEPCCGTDAAAISTRAERDGDEYAVSGEKVFITNAWYADFYIVAARTGTPESRHRGVSLLVVDRSPCVEVEKLEMLGFRGSGTGIVRFNNCRVPAGNLIGEENTGFKKIMMTLNEGRVATAATGLGVMQAAFEEAVSYAKTRTSMGQPLIRHQMVQYLISEVARLVESTRSLIYAAAGLIDARSPAVPYYSSLAKLHAAESGVQAVRLAMQVLGGLGYSRESVLERLYRDIKMIEIGDGTNEAQRMVIARYLDRGIRPEWGRLEEF